MLDIFQMFRFTYICIGLYIVPNRSMCFKNNTLFKQAHTLKVQNAIDIAMKDT